MTEQNHLVRLVLFYLDLLALVTLIARDFLVLKTGVATAFAARDILGNMLSGVSLQFSRPFTVGDTISVSLASMIG